MTKRLNDLAYRVLLRAPLNVVRQLSGVRTLLLTYHVVSDECLPHVRHLYPYRDTRQFTADLDSLLRIGRPLSLHDVLDCLRRETPLPKHSFLLTFDDGLREMHDVVAPLLRAKGIPATFFLITDFLDNRQLGHFCRQSLVVERLLRSPQLTNMTGDLLQQEGFPVTDVAATILNLPYTQQSLLDSLGHALEIDFDDYRTRHQPFLTGEQVTRLVAQGFTIGGHSLDHPSFRELPLAEQVRQAVGSVDALQQRFGINYRVFAFPHHGHGVAQKFFDEVFAHNHLEAIFGMDGFLKDMEPRSLQRLRMEYKTATATERVHEALVAQAAARLVGRATVQRQ